MVASLVALHIVTLIAMHNFIVAGASMLDALSLLILPVGLTVIYMTLYRKSHELMQDHNNSLKMLSMIQSVNDDPDFNAEIFDELEESMKEMGMELKCDMRGYMRQKERWCRRQPVRHLAFQAGLRGCNSLLHHHEDYMTWF